MTNKPELPNEMYIAEISIKGTKHLYVDRYRTNGYTKYIRADLVPQRQTAQGIEIPNLNEALKVAKRNNNLGNCLAHDKAIYEAATRYAAQSQGKTKDARLIPPKSPPYWVREEEFVPDLEGAIKSLKETQCNANGLWWCCGDQHGYETIRRCVNWFILNPPPPAAIGKPVHYTDGSISREIEEHPVVMPVNEALEALDRIIELKGDAFVQDEFATIRAALTPAIGDGERDRALDWINKIRAEHEALVNCGGRSMVVDLARHAFEQDAPIFETISRALKSKSRDDLVERSEVKK